MTRDARLGEPRRPIRTGPTAKLTLRLLLDRRVQGRIERLGRRHFSYIRVCAKKKFTLEEVIMKHTKLPASHLRKDAHDDTVRAEALRGDEFGGKETIAV